MKLLARILLFIFIAFLATPTVITLMKKCNDTSMFFSFSEEEQSHKELKAIVGPGQAQYEVEMLVYIEKKTIMSENIVKLDNISPSIFAPPPNLL